MDAERQRLQDTHEGWAAWRRWGPYLAERQWGTVREDYSQGGEAWDYLTHDMSRSYAYRWGEDGIGGICDDQQLLCLSFAFWNYRDPILKERLFGLTGKEGNHGEDVKERYYYLDSTPTHSYMQMLYKYPQHEFPYARLVDENKRRDRTVPELEIEETGSFGEDRYFDVYLEYAKSDPEDILIQVRVLNRGPETASLCIVPQLVLRNTWAWGDAVVKPSLALEEGRIRADWSKRKPLYLSVEGSPEILFCENETNTARLYGAPQDGLTKDGVHEWIIRGDRSSCSVSGPGTKAAAVYRVEVAPGAEAIVRCRLCPRPEQGAFSDFDALMAQRKSEADEFYAVLQDGMTSDDERLVQRQALAGLLWSKQFYYYDVSRWLTGDPGHPSPPSGRAGVRNQDWTHLINADVISMPDKWEYPWYAAWDLAFHCLPLALVDPELAKDQLVLMAREWYMHPNGQLPAYEWNFGDVNPPVHAWATWRIYQIDKKLTGKGDRKFLERVFHKLLLNFTWWVNRKDASGRNIFQGGFLGLDNIGVFDRSKPLPNGGHLNQADGTSWMAMYSLNMMRIALELARTNDVYEDVATKFFEHFLHIAQAMTHMAGGDIGLWDEQDKFYYDVLNSPGEAPMSLRIRSMVGLIPLFAVETLEPELLDSAPSFHRRLKWFLQHRPDLAALVSRWEDPGRGERRLLSLLRGHRMKRLLSRLLDPAEFLSDFGIRAMSKYHEEHPFSMTLGGETHVVRYTPGESDSWLFGGNSNWRGPIWFPVNYLLIESLQKFHHYYGNDFKVECPTGSGNYVSIDGVASEIAKRLVKIFLKDENGHRPVNGGQPGLHSPDHVLFYEYFHGDDGHGLGASHQTGWTGLVAKLLQPRSSERFKE